MERLNISFLWKLDKILKETGNFLKGIADFLKKTDRNPREASSFPKTIDKNQKNIANILEKTDRTQKKVYSFPKKTQKIPWEPVSYQGNLD